MFLNFGNLKNERTGDRYWGKTIEKTMLRVLRSRTFSHSLGRELPTVFAPGERLKVVSGVHFAEMPCDEP